MAQLESLRQENQFFREMVASSSGVATGHPANDPESLNGRLLVSIQERLLNIESELGRLGKKMDTHQEDLQELWYSQAPVPNVQEPVFRMDEKDNEGFFGWDEGPQWNPGQEGQEVQSSAGSSEDVEKRSLRTKDLHHLKLPNLPNDASGCRTWRNAVRTAILEYDQSPEGLLSPWLAKAFQARGAEADNLMVSSEDFPRFDRVIASVLCKQEVLRTSLGLRVQSYIEACENDGTQMTNSEFDRQRV